jgi:hypothetical protein
MWEFLANHPWWGLVYLVVICFTSLMWIMGIVGIVARRRVQVDGLMSKEKFEEFFDQATKGSTGVVN